MELVSVIMPYYRKKKYLKKTISSILEQSYQNFEIIIVYDDVDKSELSFIKEIQKLNKRISILENSTNLGSGFSRNLGIEIAKGHYVAFLDCDDIWEKNKLERQISFMKERDISFSFTAYQIIDQKENIIGKREATDVLNFNQLLNSCDIGLSTVVMKKDLIDEKCKFSNLKTKEDYVLWLNLAKLKCNLFGINEYLTKWRKLNTSLSSNPFQKLLDGYRVYNQYMKFNFFKSIYYLFKLSINFVRKNYL